MLSSEAAKTLSVTPSLLIGTNDPVRIHSFVPVPSCPQNSSITAWTSEHANTVRAMCPGGLTIIGICIGTSSNSDNQTLTRAARLARRVTTDDPSVNVAIILVRSENDRFSARTVTTQDVLGDSLKVGDVHMFVATPLIELHASVSFQGNSVSIDKSSSDKEIELAVVTHVEKLIDQAVISILSGEGKDVAFITDETDSQAFSSVSGMTSNSGLGMVSRRKGKSKAKRSAEKKKESEGTNLRSTQVVSIQMHLPFGLHRSHLDNEESYEDAFGITQCTLAEQHSTTVSMTGRLAIRGAVFEDATTGEALRAVRQDVSRSLRARLRAKYDDDDGSENGEGDSEGKCLARDDEVCLEMPVRIIGHTVSGDKIRRFSVTEYIARGESVSDVHRRVTEILSWTHTDIQKSLFVPIEEHHAVISKKARVNGSIQNESESNMDLGNTVLDGVTVEGASETNLGSEDETSVLHQALVNMLIGAVVVVVLAIILRQIL